MDTNDKAEANRKYQREYREKNKDRLAAHRKVNSKRRAAVTKAWAEENKGVINKAQRAYYRKDPERRVKWNKQPKARYSKYKSSAKTKGRPFDLTFEDFMTMWQVPCHYCGDPVETIGIDRVDNTKGYTRSNVVSCCSICNFAKKARTQEEFIAHAHRIAHAHPKMNP